MKRLLTGVIATAAVLGAGTFASACNAAPTAASANGATISTASLNNQLKVLESTAAGGCLLALENTEISPAALEGDGGSGTYATEFAGAILQNQVSDLLAEQYAATKGISVSSADVATAKSDFEATLDGEINQQVETAQSEGITSDCQEASGSTISGAQLLAALPSDIAAAQVRNQAVDEKLLALGADLSDAAVFKYYTSNLPQFTQACVSRIVTATQADANQVVLQLDAGASFASVAKAKSIDTQTAADGGSLGCDFTQAQVEQALEQQSIQVGKVLAPVQDSSSGQWYTYEITSQSVEPLTAAEAVVRRELLEATANVDRVSREIVAFARRSDVSVNPQYGTWKGLTIVPPTTPPTRFLLPSVSGASATSAANAAGSSLGASGVTGAAGTGGATGAPATAGSAGSSSSAG
jgi:parvulin-like peptidyl-prolyl isomerase